MENLIVGAVGAILSLVLFYAPGSESAWAKLDGQYKRLVILGACALIAAASFALPCIGVAVEGAVCPPAIDASFAWQFAVLVLNAAGAAQIAYTFVPNKPE